MPLTGAEKQRKYRERMRNDNPEKFEEARRKNAERNKKRKKINTLTETEKKIERKKWRDRKRRERNKISEDTAPVNNSFDNTAEIIRRAKQAIARKFYRKLAQEKTKYEEKINKMKKQIRLLQKKCKRSIKRNENLIGVIEELKTKHAEPPPNQNPVTTQDQNEMTPLSKSDSFIENNLPNISNDEKEKVKRQLLNHNVLVNALQTTYKATKNNRERNIFKGVIDNEVVKKYKATSEMSSYLGLKGRARRCKDIRRKNNIIIEEIKRYYERDDVSRATAGKKEVKVLKKQKKQRRYLIKTLKVLYKKYKEQGGRAKYSSFKKYRPFYVMRPKLSNRETCGCIKHENFMMKIRKLKTLGMIETQDMDEILSKNVCDVKSKKCCYRQCSICKDQCVTFNRDIYNGTEIVNWGEFRLENHQYVDKADGNTKNTKKMIKKEIFDSVDTLTSKFNEELKVMTKHEFNINHQYIQYVLCTENLKDTEVAFHIDFSENYVCKLATEVQSMHFGASKSQITIHTGVFYIKNKDPQSFATITPCNDHGPEAIWAHMDPIINHVRHEYPDITEVHFFSDGPTVQYRQKKNFFLFSKCTKELGFTHGTWNFSEASHGKGAADGVGAAIKTRLDNFVAQGVDIADAYKAFEVLKNSDTKVMVYFIPESDIRKNTIKETLTPVPETMSIHQVVSTESIAIIKFRCLSCFCTDNLSRRGNCNCYDIKNHNLQKCNLLNMYENPQPSSSGTQRNKKKKKTGKNYKSLSQKNSSDSSTETDGEYSVHDTSEEDFCITHDDIGNTDLNFPPQLSYNETSNGFDIIEGIKDNEDVDQIETLRKQQADEIPNELENQQKIYEHSTELKEKENIPMRTETNCNLKQIEKNDSFIVGDSVIVRYYEKKSWKYYVGFIENKLLKEENAVYYSIKFLKTIKNPTLKFLVTKKEDRDTVPAICIVKKVALICNPKESLLKDVDCDKVYF